MRLAIGFFISGLTALLMGTPALAQTPIKAGDTLTGTLRFVTSRHPNGTKLEAYQIVSAPRAMPADDDFCEAGRATTTFHLFTNTDAARRQLKPLLGKQVTVKADTLFCSHTAWHVGDAGVSEWVLISK